MARNRQRRVIYDNDATVVTETASMADDVTVVARAESNTFQQNSINMSILDIMDTFAGYLPTRFKITKDNEDVCKCMICGKDTAYSIRKMCVDCMDKYSDRVYQLAREATNRGDTTFILK